MRPDELLTLLDKKGTAVISLVTMTEPTFLSEKTTGPNPFKHVLKKTYLTGMIGWLYETAVNQQREKEGLEPVFEAVPRKWGERIYPGPFVRHIKDGEERWYLEVKVERIISLEYVDRQGAVYEREAVEKFIRPASTASRQGVRDEIILRDYNLNSIIQLSYKGEVYIIDER